MPLILADTAFISTLTAVEKQIADLKITDGQSAQAAADLQQRLTTAGKKLDATRLELKRPFIAISTQIDATAREPMARIETAKNTLRHAQIAWDTKQRQIAADAERVRQAELLRLEKLRQAEEAEARRKADELAKLAAEMAEKNKIPALELDWDDGPAEPPPKTETEKAIEAVKFAPAVVTPQAQGVRFKTSIKPIVEDVNKLPDAFVEKTAKLQAIRATFCSGWKEGAPLPVLDGVRFEIERTVDSTGRARF